MLVLPAPIVAVARKTTLDLEAMRISDTNEVASDFTDTYGNPASANDIKNVQAWVFDSENRTRMAVMTKSISNGTYRYFCVKLATNPTNPTQP